MPDTPPPPGSPSRTWSAASGRPWKTSSATPASTAGRHRLIATLEQVAARLHSLRLVLLRWEQSQRRAALHRCVELLRETREVEREGLSCLLESVRRAAA